MNELKTEWRRGAPTGIRWILLTSLLAVLLLPLLTVLVIHPAFHRLMDENATRDAEQITRHMVAMLALEERNLRKEETLETLDRLAPDFLRNFQLLKFKLFASSGECVYSTDKEDVGIVNTYPYFQEVVARGRVHSKMIAQNTYSQEGKALKVDAIGMYVPIMREGRFHGALETYQDITDNKAKLTSILSRLYFIVFLGTGVLFILVVGSALKTITAFRKREEAEEQRHVSEERYASLFRSSQDGIIIHDLDGKILDINEMVLKQFGCTREEILSRSVASLHPPDELEKSRCAFETIRKNGYVRFEIDFVRTNGERFPAEVSSSIFEYSGEQVVQGTIRDISQRREMAREREVMSEHLFQAQKMEAVGQLSGGIAHDFNNLLTAISGYGEILRLKLGPDNPLQQNVEMILSSAEKAGKLTDGLLAFGRRQVLSPKPTSLNEIVRGAEKLLRRLIGEHIELCVELADEDPVIMADSVQLEQVILNLATNARDAMPEGGVFTIATSVFTLGKEYIESHRFGTEGDYAKLTAADNGSGMDAKTRERIFEPFFTTKEVGKGSGLGLAVGYGIIKQHGGFITVQSSPGKGTTFEILMPLIRSEAEAATATLKPIPVGGDETILLAEDDPVVRDVVRRVLSGAGYAVIEAENGNQAVEKFRESKGAVDLLLLDAVMPVMNGYPAFEAMRREQPEVRVLFTSGYSSDLSRRREIIAQDLDFIKKPAKPFDLLEKVREILDRK